MTTQLTISSSSWVLAHCVEIYLLAGQVEFAMSVSQPPPELVGHSLPRRRSSGTCFGINPLGYAEMVVVPLGAVLAGEPPDGATLESTFWTGNKWVRGNCTLLLED